MEFSPAQRRPPRHPKYDAIHRALLTGLLSNVGTKGEAYEYLAPRSVKFSIFPGSALFSQKPRWLMAAELVETTKLYARTCAGVQPQWIEQAALHLVERTHSDPRWDAQTGTTIATEKVTLYGLVLIPARNVPYGPINPKISRDIFLQHALVLGELPLPYSEMPFLKFNRQLVAEVELLEAKIRQRNLLADAATRFTFYDARVPQGITDIMRFDQWRREAENANPRLLYMSKEDLLRSDAPAITTENYPDKVSESGGGLRLPLNYRFEPGEVIDGVTLTVPLAALPQLRPQRYEWLVPGMLEEKIASLLRGLSGPLRRNFVPVPEWAKAAAAALTQKWEAPGGTPSAAAAPQGVAPTMSLRDALAEYLVRQSGVEVKGADFTESDLPAHLRMNFRVMDDSGKVVGLSRDLGQLQRKLHRETAGTFAAIQQREFNQDAIRSWVFGDLPDSITVQRFNMTIVAYPALVDQGASCSLRLLPSPQDAQDAHRAGVRRLFSLEFWREIKGLTARLPDFTRMKLEYLLLGRSAELRDDLVALIVDRALFGAVETPAAPPAPRKQADYEQLKAQAAARLESTAENVAALVVAILDEHLKLALAAEAQQRPSGGRRSPAETDIHDQLVYLLPKHFLVNTPYTWLEHFPRYLSAARLRMEKLRTGGAEVAARDDANMAKLLPWWHRYLARRRAHDEVALRDPELELARWMIEEWRVALFTQELGTTVGISERRIEKQWEKVRQ